MSVFSDFLSFMFLYLLSMHCMYVFATVPGSIVNSWDSWFIFNLRKNKHLLLHDILYMGRNKRILCCRKKVCTYIDNATLVVSQMLIVSAILAVRDQ